MQPGEVVTIEPHAKLATMQPNELGFAGGSCVTMPMTHTHCVVVSALHGTYVQNDYSCPWTWYEVILQDGQLLWVEDVDMCDSDV